MLSPRVGFCLLWRTDGSDAFVQDYHQKVLIFGDILRENLENCIKKVEYSKQTKKDGDVLKFWVSEHNPIFSYGLGHFFFQFPRLLGLTA